LLFGRETVGQLETVTEGVPALARPAAMQLWEDHKASARYQ
jgi:hypothetical protein